MRLYNLLYIDIVLWVRVCWQCAINSKRLGVSACRRRRIPYVYDTSIEVSGVS